VLQSLVLVALVGAIVPILPHMPGSGLDPSWRMAMNHAVAEGIDIGRDLAFTLGPYVSVYTGEYHPATDGLAVAASSYFALSFWFGLLVIGWRDRRLAGLALLAVTLAAGIHPHDSWLMAYPMLVGVFAFHASSPRDAPGWSRSLLSTALAFAPLGLLAIIKGSLATLCIGVAALGATQFLMQRMVRHALVAALVPMASLILSWIAAGQDPTGIPHFFRSLGEVTSGYSEAMSLPGPMIDIAAFAIATVWVLGTIALLPDATKRARLFLLALFSLVLLVAYKAGFVRHDGHALIATSAVLMAAIVLAASTRSRFALAGLLVVTTCTLVTHRGYHIATPERYTHRLLATLSEVRQGLVERLSGGDAIRARYQASIAHLARAASFPDLQGTVDIYSFNQSLLIASGLDWNPRPTFQSYAAYTPALARWNREHLEGPRSPDHLLFRVETIDGRLPSLDDGSSWPTILARFTPRRMVGDYLHLEGKAATGTAPATRPQPIGTSARFGFGDVVTLPAGAAPIFAKIRVRPSIPGRFVALLHKSSHLRLAATLADGSTRDFRVVSGLLGEGVVISPLVENTTEFALLLTRPGDLSGKTMTSFAIRPSAHAWQWQPEIEVEFARLDAPTASPGFDLRPLDARVDLGPDVAPSEAVRCDGALDVVDGTSSAAPMIDASGVLLLVGWVSPDAREHLVPEAILLVLTDTQGAAHYYSTRQSARPNVGAASRGRPLAVAAFEARLDVGALAGRLEVGVAFLEQGRVRRCLGSKTVERR
jgi:hypothetical protein